MAKKKKEKKKKKVEKKKGGESAAPSEAVQEEAFGAEEKIEFTAEIDINAHGYVKIRARNKNEARRVLEAMNRKKLLSFYKEQVKFLKIGEIKATEEHD